jgi:hypothetical protein
MPPLNLLQRWRKFVKALFFLIFILFFATNKTNAQLVGQVTMDVEVGSSISMGKPKIRNWTSSVNPAFGINYNYKEKYKYPSVRVRAAIKKNLSSQVAVGIRTGMEMHYREYNPASHLNVYVFPLQLVGEVKTFKIREKTAAFINFAAGNTLNGGWKIFDSDGGFIQKKGGPILSLEIKLAKTDKLSSFYYKGGLEYEETRWLHKFVSTVRYGPNAQMEMIRLKSFKEQVFLAVGVTF